MKNNLDTYEMILSKIKSMKKNFPELKEKKDEYVFTALCVRANFYTNPGIPFTQQTIDEFLVDGTGDGGVDALLSDPNSEASDLIMVQSKFYQQITLDDIKNAVSKMIYFYKNMRNGSYSGINTTVQQKFLQLNAEVGDESIIRFVFFTSAPKNNIHNNRIEKLVSQAFPNDNKYEIDIFYADDIIEIIRELESRRPLVESGEIHIDQVDNYLVYEDDSVIVNVSAFSLKQLYAIHSNNLLAKNLRYFVRNKIDSEIDNTIKNEPEYFWYRNNGVTIICEDFEIDGKVVKLKDFSVINGGQTTYRLHKSDYLTKDHDFYLPCKIIRTIGGDEDAKSSFILDIAKATNSQKPIKPVDLKANAPEQLRFMNEMRDVGIFYKTKRGEEIPKQFKESYLNTDLAAVGKLALSGIFQLPATSRNKPSTIYDDKYYNVIFNSNQSQVASITRELLYIDNYFRKNYIKEFSKNSNTQMNTFANNARTLCIAFAAIAGRIYSGNLKKDELQMILNHCTEQKFYETYGREYFSNLGDIKKLLPNFENKDTYDQQLKKLFDMIIKAGFTNYKYASLQNVNLNETNFLKNDTNYFTSLSTDPMLFDSINEAFDN